MKSRSFTLFETSIKSAQTRKNYVYSLNEFMKFSKITKYDELAKIKPQKVQNLLQNWVMHLGKNGLKAITIRTKLSAVELFLEMNQVVFHKKIIHRLIPSDDYVAGGDVPFTTDEIQKMLEATTKLRSKALIHFLASTGARPASIVDPVLRLEHLEEMHGKCMAVKLYDGSKQGYWAFLTPEATDALNQYFNSRRLNGEKLTPESPVFANFPKKSWSKKGNHLSSKGVKEILTNVIKGAGIKRKKVGNRYDKAVSYGFRKRFNTILKLNNNVNSNITEKLMAHKRGLDGSYLKPTKEECFKEFVKAIPELVIDSSQRQKAIIVKQKETISELEKKENEIDELKKWKQTMDEKVNHLLLISLPFNEEAYTPEELKKAKEQEDKQRVQLSHELLQMINKN